MNTLSLLIIGFSIIGAGILLCVYCFFLNSLKKTRYSMISCALLLSTLSGIQLFHFEFYQNQIEPFDSSYYQVLLFVVPPLFYVFSRSILFTATHINIKDLLHFIPVFIPIVSAHPLIPSIAFFIGACYCIWLSRVVIKVRQQHHRFGAEIFFFSLFAVIALIVLVLGLSTAFMDNIYFYYFYTFGIGVCFTLIVGALIAFPELLEDINEAVKLSYSVSTLGQIDVDDSMEKLNRLIQQEKFYQNENINLNTVAEQLNLTGHQLSELINTNLNMNFSKYIRKMRVEAAKSLLINEPDASILAISMETGFKSQSNFYVAFKEMVGCSPGAFRKNQTE